MKITANNQNINFNGRYKILLSTKEFEKFKSDVLPILDKQHNKNVDYFYGKMPIDTIFDEALDKHAKNSGGSRDWAYKNLARHGIKFQNSDNSILYNTTGEKDCNLLFQIDDKLGLKFDVRKIVNIFRIFRKKPNINPNLLEILATDKALNDISKTFYRFTLRHPFKKIKSLDEIIFENPHKLYGEI